MIILGYIDPGLGALIWQTIVAAVVGVLFYLKKTRRWIVGLFRKNPGRGGAKVAANNPVSAKVRAAKTEAEVEMR